VSAEQVVLHAVVLAQTRLFGQGLEAPAVQLPAPLQAPTAVSWPALQEVVPQLTLDCLYRQPPLPSQVPSCPQAVLSTAQAPADEPPAATGRQAPVAQVMQVPVQAVAQQTLPTQAPFEHWLFAEQVDPFPCFALQAPPEQ
jgi:hypothetical protein